MGAFSLIVVINLLNSLLIMVQCAMANLSTLEPYKSDVLECCTFHYVQDVDDLSSQRVTFKPLFAHQLFGEDETIFGYKDLAIDLFYTIGSLKCYLRVTHLGKISEDAAETKADPDPIETLKDNFVGGFTKVEAEFVKDIKKDQTFEPCGNMIMQYTKFEGHKEKQFCLFKCGIETPGLVEQHQNMQTFLTWFIDGSSFIDDEDPAWMFYSVYEKFTLDGNTRYAFVGYSTVYLFFCYPDKKRARISQFLIMPPYLRKGHGSKLMRLIYNDLKAMSEVQDITVEDPSEDFVSMRDAVDCHYVIESFPGLFEQENKLKQLSKALKLQCRDATKINTTQFKHVYEILEFHYINGKDKKQMQKYRKGLRSRVRKSLKRPKTKLSDYELKMDATANGVDENNDPTDMAEEEGMQGATLMEGEFLETRVEEIYDRILTHYMQVSSKLSTIL